MFITILSLSFFHCASLTRNPAHLQGFFFDFFAAFFTFGLSFSGLCGVFNALLSAGLQSALSLPCR
jgi:hypothetical protein